MRSQGTESKIAKHVIDVNYSSRENTVKYIHDIAYKINEKLSGPESALLLSDLYDEEFGMIGSSIEDDLIGPVLHRDQEDVRDFSRYESLVDLYLKFDINKFYGLSINEFLSHTRQGRNVLIKKAEDRIIEINEKLKDMDIDSDFLDGNN